MTNTVTTRALALGTVAAVAIVGAVSGVFATFSVIGNSACGAYGYGYDPATSVYSYGYNPSCTIISGGGSGGGGGGGSSIISTSSGGSGYVSPTTTPTTTPTTGSGNAVELFPDFAPQCTTDIKNLTDPRIGQEYVALNVVNTSNPNRTLTRSEFLKLLLNAAGVNVSSQTVPTQYSDVTTANTLYKYIAYATTYGIVSGSNGTFRPDAVITRAETAKILVRATDLGMATSATTFSDVSPSNSLALYIQTAYDNCILHGRDTINGSTTLASGVRVFEPNSGITLAETAKVLYNVSH